MNNFHQTQNGEHLSNKKAFAFKIISRFNVTNPFLLILKSNSNVKIRDVIDEQFDAENILYSFLKLSSGIFKQFDAKVTQKHMDEQVLTVQDFQNSRKAERREENISIFELLKPPLFSAFIEIETSGRKSCLSSLLQYSYFLQCDWWTHYCTRF